MESDLLKTFGIDGRIVSIDLTPPTPSYHPANVTFLHGDAHDNAPTVIEDADIIHTGQDREGEGGPARAIAEFLRDHGNAYEIDTRYCDHYGRNVTGNLNGYLRKK